MPPPMPPPGGGPSSRSGATEPGEPRVSSRPRDRPRRRRPPPRPPRREDAGYETSHLSCRPTWDRSTCRTEASTRPQQRSRGARVPGHPLRAASTASDAWPTSWRSRAIYGAPPDWPRWSPTRPRGPRAQASIMPRWRGRGSPWSAQTSRRRVGGWQSWPTRSARTRIRGWLRACSSSRRGC
jgi:hypothetical protein